VLVVVDEAVGGRALAVQLRDVAGIAAAQVIALNGKEGED